MSEISVEKVFPELLRRVERRGLEALREEIERSHEEFIEHYGSKYMDPERRRSGQQPRS